MTGQNTSSFQEFSWFLMLQIYRIIIMARLFLAILVVQPIFNNKNSLLSRYTQFHLLSGILFLFMLFTYCVKVFW